MGVPWPSELQDIINEAGFGHDMGDTVLRSEMDVGVAKLRRTSTRPIDGFNCTINLTSAQYSIYYSYFNTSLNGGVTPFSFDHPITGVATDFRFVGAPGVRSLGGGNFQVTMQWEKLP